jgi:hypothetical protein
MTPDEQLWWNWGVQAVVAIATLATVVVALFGDVFRAWIFRPTITLALRDQLGEATTITLTDPLSGNQRSEKARYYHLRVANTTRWTATDVQVFLTRLDIKDTDGRFQTAWRSETPVRWMMQEIHPIARKLGAHAHADCDLLAAVKDKWVELCLLVTPNNLPARHRDAVEFIATFHARAVETSSEEVRISVKWDQGWSDSTAEMKRHLKVDQAE